MTRQSVWSGTFQIFGVDVRCHVLNDGRRIIEADSFAELLAAMQNAAGPPSDDDMEAFAVWQRAGRLDEWAAPKSTTG